MDIFIEKLVARKKTAQDVAFAIGAIVFTILVILTLFPFVLYLPFLAVRMVGSLAMVGLVYLCYWTISKRTIEFEYSLTNNELDIETIIARRKRKKLITVDIKRIDILAPVSSEKYRRERNSQTVTQTYDCSSGANNDETYFTVFIDQSGRKCLLLFEPNEKMIAGFARYNPNKVFRA